MIKRFYLVGLLLLCLVLPFGSSAFGYSKVVSFGDSLSDNGNADGYGLGVSTNPNADGTDGSVWVDYLAQDLGIGLLDMAYGAAQTNNHPWTGPSEVWGFNWQINTYLSEFDLDKTDGAGKYTIDDEALYTVWIGGNDLLNITNPFDAPTVVANAVTNIAGGINDLVTAGAQNILVMNMPNLGLTPLMNGEYDGLIVDGTEFVDTPYYGTLLAAFFNMALDFSINPFTNRINLMEVDIFTLMGEFIDDGLFVDYEHMLAAALASGETDLSYLFWDAIHPTTYAHGLIADEAFKVVAPVPEPATMLLFGLGLLGLAGVNRRKQ